MANRQALRDLQTRLAERLQQARLVGVPTGWLAVEAAGRNLLFPLDQAGEIFSFKAVQPVPYTQSWFLGVANLRGGLYGVVDLSGYLTGDQPARRNDFSNDQAHLIVLNPVIEVNCALLIDRLVGLRSAQDFVSRETPAENFPHFFTGHMIDQAGQSWYEISLQTMVADGDFLNINSP